MPLRNAKKTVSDKSRTGTVSVAYRKTTLNPKNYSAKNHTTQFIQNVEFHRTTFN